MNKRFWIIGSIVVSLVFLFGMFAIINGFSSQTEIATDQTEMAGAGPKLWQEKEPLALVPSQRDVDIWRSVRVPPAGAIEELLRDQGKLSLDASPVEREQAVKEWMKRANKDAYFGPDPRAYEKLMEREKALLNTDTAAISIQEEGFPTPQKNVLGVVYAKVNVKKITFL